MIINRVENATRNIFWGFIEKSIFVLLPFITRTILIKVLGADYVGLNSLFVSILQVLSISELGLGSAIVFSMYKPIAHDDNYTVCALLNIYRKLYYIVGFIILFLGILIIPFLPKLISGSCPSDVNIFILYAIYLLNTVLSYFLYAYKTSLFSAFQRNDVISKISFITTIFSNILQIIVLLTIKNYYVYILIIPISTIFTNLTNAYLSKKIYPQFYCKGKISNKSKINLKKRIIGLLSNKIYGVIFSSVDSIVISAFLGLIPLAIYNNYYVIQTAIISFIIIFTDSITAGIGNKMVTNTVNENYEDFKKIVFINAWIVSWVSITLFCMYQHFMTIWVGKELVFPFLTMTLMVLYFYLPRLTTITSTYKVASGLWWEDRWRPLISTIVNLVASIILVQFFGVNGVIISTLFCSIFINIPWGTHILFKHYFKSSSLEYFKIIISHSIITLLNATITFLICKILHDNLSIYTLLIKLLICIIIPNIIFFIFYRKTDEFIFAKKLFLQIINRYIKKGELNV